MRMPEANGEIIARRWVHGRAIEALAPGAVVIGDEEGLRAYESDGLTAYAQRPLLAVLPETREEVGSVLRYCAREKIKVVARGAGTSLSGGALPLADGIVLGLARFRKILEIDEMNRCAVVEPGVANSAITHAAMGSGLYYAPDPSSQSVCTIGGNVAENAGGVHCLKYGLTVNNLLGLEAFLIDGHRLRLGGRHEESGGYDLLGLLSGSEGLLGVITEAIVRLRPKPAGARGALAGFGSVEAAGETVAGIIGAGIVPAGMELMDGLALRAAEAYAGAGYPQEAEALVILELDGTDAEIASGMDSCRLIAEGKGATSFLVSRTEEERERFWSGRKAAFPAVGRLSPDYYCMDGTIPRRQIAPVLRRIGEMSKSYGLAVANVFHAGDGNLHPLILYDANKAGDLEKAEAFGAEILRLCVKVGGVLTGEHGVGVEKRDLMGEMFDEKDLDQQQRVKCAFDAEGLLNPGKMFPRLRRCAELGRMHVHRGRLAFPEIERF